MWWVAYVLLPGNKEEKFVMWAGGQSRNTAQKLWASLSLSFQEPKAPGLWALLSVLPFEIRVSQRCSHPELLFKHRGTPRLSPDSSCTNTTHSPNHSCSLPWFHAPSASCGLTAAEITPCPCPHSVCVWAALPEQLCLHSLLPSVWSSKEIKTNYWIRTVLNVFEWQIRPQRMKRAAHTFIDYPGISWVERYPQGLLKSNCWGPFLALHKSPFTLPNSIFLFPKFFIFYLLISLPLNHSTF